MKLAGAESLGSGAVNEDACGFLGGETNITAAWVLDGVTGINDTTLPGIVNDAAWFVSRTSDHLRALLPQNLTARALVAALVDALTIDVATARGTAILPESFDPPAACLMLARRTSVGWEAIRLGDFILLARDAAGTLIRMVDFPNDAFDQWFEAESHRLRVSGITAAPAIRKVLAAALRENRRNRNRPGFYGVLEADPSCLDFIETRDLGHPRSILLATDGFSRLATIYGALSEDELVDACGAPGGVPSLMQRLRAIEAADPSCMTYPRHKPADDATAVALTI